ncbi:MAG TPA: hypothetical protein PK280_18960 [Planctomycetota bacterium]|nr:hypothetical protein [Planctomycetota bacterium]
MKERPRLFANKEKAKARALEEQAREVAGRRRSDMLRVVLAASLAGVAVGVVVWFAVKAGDERAVAPQQLPPRTLEQTLDKGEEWFDAAQDGRAGERLKGILAQNPGLKPGQQTIKTGRVAMRLRTLDGKWGPAPKESEKPEKPAVPPVQEAGGAPGTEPLSAPPPSPPSAEVGE